MGTPKEDKKYHQQGRPVGDAQEAIPTEALSKPDSERAPLAWNSVPDADEVKLVPKSGAAHSASEALKSRFRSKSPKPATHEQVSATQPVPMSKAAPSNMHGQRSLDDMARQIERME